MTGLTSLPISRTAEYPPDNVSEMARFGTGHVSIEFKGFEHAHDGRLVEPGPRMKGADRRFVFLVEKAQYRKAARERGHRLERAHASPF
jgi:hypothetical protein